MAQARATIADHGADPAALDLIDQIDAAVATARADRQKLALVVPLINRLRGIQTFIALKADQFCVPC